MSIRPIITLQPSGRQFEAEPSETILAAALRQGIRLPYACRRGACGACLATWLSGEFCQDVGRPRMPDPTGPGGPRVRTCCSRALGNATLLVTELKASEANPPRRLPARVASIERLSHDVAIVRLRLPTGERLTFAPGQFVGLLAPDGRPRCFSIASSPGSHELELHIGRASPTGFTAHVNEAMQSGDLLRIEGPHGQFGLRTDRTRPILMVAGGTGFAPLQSMIDALAQLDSTRPIHLYWGNRSPSGFYAPQAITRWQARMPGFRFTPVLSRPDAVRSWGGRSGRVHQAVLDDWPSLADFDVYVCGAPALVAAAEVDFLQSAGLPPEQFHADAFHSQGTQLVAPASAA